MQGIKEIRLLSFVKIVPDTIDLIQKMHIFSLIPSSEKIEPASHIIENFD